MSNITHIRTNVLSHEGGRRQAASPARARTFITHSRTNDIICPADEQAFSVCKTPLPSSNQKSFYNLLVLNGLCGFSKSYTPSNECFLPYQLTGASGGNNDAPIFQHFCAMGTLLHSNYRSFIIPARWFAAGRENLLKDFRTHMLTSGLVSKLVTYSSSKELFSNVEIKGGVCYYLEQEIGSNDGLCDYTLIDGESVFHKRQSLNKFDILIRDPRLSDLVEKILIQAKNEGVGFVESIISSDTPFGIPSNPRTSPKSPFDVFESKSPEHDVLLYHIISVR